MLSAEFLGMGSTSSENWKKNYLWVNDKPQEVKNNGNSYPNNSESHVELIKEVLGKDEHDHGIPEKIKEVVFVEHDEQFQTNQNRSH